MNLGARTYRPYWFVFIVCLATHFTGSGPVTSVTPRYRAESRARARQTFRRQKKQKAALRKPDVIYYPTPNETVAEMLKLAHIKPGDVLYDLGSGDGRIPIMAAQMHGIRAVGIEIDAKLIPVAEEAARLAGVSGLVQFRNEDLFRANIGEASVVTLYLSERLNLRLRPKLLRELRPGTRVISHDFLIGDWKPKRVVKVPWKANLYRTIYLWTIPHP